MGLEVTVPRQSVDNLKYKLPYLCFTVLLVYRLARLKNSDYFTSEQFKRLLAENE